MQITNYHYIKSLNLPANWIEAETVEGGMNGLTVRSFAPGENITVRIELFYRGLPLNSAETSAFRKALSIAPRIIFDSNTHNNPTAFDLQLMIDLEEPLGHIGNNQIVNKNSGRRGPPFMLTRLESLIWNGKAVLGARGFFKNPEDGKRVSEFCGFFIDPKPTDVVSSVEEIYLQTPNEELYLRYLPVFRDFATSIEWLIT